MVNPARYLPCGKKHDDTTSRCSIDLAKKFLRELRAVKTEKSGVAPKDDPTLSLYRSEEASLT